MDPIEDFSETDALFDQVDDEEDTGTIEEWLEDEWERCGGPDG